MTSFMGSENGIGNYQAPSEQVNELGGDVSDNGDWGWSLARWGNKHGKDRGWNEWE
jgi:hypothetical protein